MSSTVMEAECQIGKSIFAVKLPFKLFRASVANADLVSLKSLHTFIDTCWRNFGSPTRVTSLKVAPNMADTACMKHSINSP